MNRRSALSLALLAVMACGGSTPHPQPIPATPLAADAAKAAQVAKAQTLAPATGDDAPLALWPLIKKGTLPNGLTYYILKHDKPEQRAYLWLAVNAGSILEDDDQRGLAHFCEHMAFNGTAHFAKSAIVDYIEKIGMRFGADLNAYTSFDETVYQLEVPTNDPGYLGKGLDILRDWAGDVTFDPAEVEKERGVVLEEWRLGRGAFQRLFDKSAKVLFAGSRYADRLTIGQADTIKQAPRDTLYRFYKDWYRPDLMSVMVVGDVDPAWIQGEVERRFGTLKNPTKERPRGHGEVPKATGTRVSIETDRELPFAAVSVYNLLPHRPEASANNFRRTVVEQLYQLILDDRLGSVARHADAPFRGAQVGISSITREIDGFVRTAPAKGANVEDALRGLFTEVLRVERHGFTAGELERARKVLQRGIEQSALEQETRDGREFIQEMTRNFFEDEMMTGRTVEAELTKRFLATVTLAELNGLAKAFGGADNRVVEIVGPDGKPQPTRDRVLAIIAEVEKSEITPWEDFPPGAALMDQKPTPGKVVAEKQLASIGVTEWTLSNGVRVVVKPTDFAKDRVEIQGSSPGGLATVKDADYATARFAETLVAMGGVGALDAEALAKSLAGKEASASTFIGETTEGVSAGGSAADLETSLQLLYLRMTAPRRDDKLFPVWKANTKEQLENQQAQPEVKFGIESSETLFRGHPRRKTPTPADLDQLDLGKAMTFYQARFGDAADFTFVIVGAVDLATLKPLVETYLASLPAKGRKEKELDPKVRKVGGVVTKTWKLGKAPKGTVRIDFHGDETWTRDRDRDVFVLGQVLSIRLREILREDMGSVYGVGARGSISRSPHQERSFGISFGCAPENVAKLVKAVFDEAHELATKGTTEAYLEKVRQTFLRGRETALKSNAFWLGWLAESYRYGDDPTIVLDPKPMLARMTSANVQAAAKRYLDPKQYYQAVMVPAEWAGK
jgi:zinc protease